MSASKRLKLKEEKPKRCLIALPAYNPDTHSATCYVVHNVFSSREVARYLKLSDAWPWERLQVKLPFGKGIGTTNRDVCLASLVDAQRVRYRYSGTDQHSFEAPTEIQEMVSKMCTVLGIENKAYFNGALNNRYVASKHDNLGMHADDEVDLSKRTIACISLSETPWRFDIMHIATKQKLRVTLPPGSVFVMDGDMQEHWKHGVPSQSSFASGRRVSITCRRFRPILEEQNSTENTTV